MNREKLKEIYIKYNLDKDDIFTLKFGSKDKPIITRAGVEKIQAQLGIKINYKIEKLSEDHKSCIIFANGVIISTDTSGKAIPKAMAQSYGEVSPANNTNP